MCPKNCSIFGYSTFLITLLTETDKIVIKLEHGNKVKSKRKNIYSQLAPHKAYTNRLEFRINTFFVTAYFHFP